MRSPRPLVSVERCQGGEPTRVQAHGHAAAKRPGIDHLLRANEAYTEQHGNHYAAAITYFSVLSLVPLAAGGVRGAGFVLAAQPDLLAQLQDDIASRCPRARRDLLDAR